MYPYLNFFALVREQVDHAAFENSRRGNSESTFIHWQLLVEIHLMISIEVAACNLCQCIGNVSLHLRDAHEPSIKTWSEFRDICTQAGHLITEERTQSAEKYLEGVVSALWILIKEAKGLSLLEKQALRRLRKLYQNRIQGYAEKRPSRAGNGRRGLPKKMSVSSRAFTLSHHVYDRGRINKRSGPRAVTQKMG